MTFSECDSIKVKLNQLVMFWHAICNIKDNFLNLL